MDIPDIGEQVTIIKGAFSSFKGTIEAVNEARKTAEVRVVIFGRPTTVQVRFDDLLWSTPIDPTRLAEALSQLDHDDAKVRAAAAEALGAFGPRAGLVLPDLIGVLHRDRRAAVREAAARAIGNINAVSAQSALVTAFSDRSSRVVAAALESLRFKRTEDDPTLRRAIAGLLASPHERIQDAAVATLTTFRSTDPEDLDALLRVVAEGASLSVRRRAAFGLTWPRVSVAGAIPALIRLADDLRTDPRRIDTAHYALGRLGAVDVLAGMLSDPDPIQRSHAAVALCSCEDPDQVPAICDALLRCTADWQKSAIITALASMEHQGRPAAGALVGMVDQPNLQGPIIETLGSIGAAQALVGLTDHVEESIQAAAMHTLASRWGLDPAVCVPALKRALHSDSPRIRRSGIRGLKPHRDLPGVREELEALRSREDMDINLRTLTEVLGTE